MFGIRRKLNYWLYFIDNAGRKMTSASLSLHLTDFVVVVCEKIADLLQQRYDLYDSFVWVL